MKFALKDILPCFALRLSLMSNLSPVAAKEVCQEGIFWRQHQKWIYREDTTTKIQSFREQNWGLNTFYLFIHFCEAIFNTFGLCMALIFPSPPINAAQLSQENLLKPLTPYSDFLLIYPRSMVQMNFHFKTGFLASVGMAFKFLVQKLRYLHCK